MGCIRKAGRSILLIRADVLSQIKEVAIHCVNSDCCYCLSSPLTIMEQHVISWHGLTCMYTCMTVRDVHLPHMSLLSPSMESAKSILLRAWPVCTHKALG